MTARLKGLSVVTCVEMKVFSLDRFSSLVMVVWVIVSLCSCSVCADAGVVVTYVKLRIVIVKTLFCNILFIILFMLKCYCAPLSFAMVF